jgi:hypothetical protein
MNYASYASRFIMELSRGEEAEPMPERKGEMGERDK